MGAAVTRSAPSSSREASGRRRFLTITAGLDLVFDLVASVCERRQTWKRRSPARRWIRTPRARSTRPRAWSSLRFCVIMTSNKTNKILAALEMGAGTPDDAEDARKIYVAAYRAMRLLVIAVPRNSSPELEPLLAANGCTTQRHDVV